MIRALLRPQLNIKHEGLVRWIAFLSESVAGALLRGPVTEVLNCVQELRSGYGAISCQHAEPPLNFCHTVLCCEGEDYGAILLTDQLYTWNRFNIRRRLINPENYLQQQSFIVAVQISSKTSFCGLQPRMEVLAELPRVGRAEAGMAVLLSVSFRDRHLPFQAEVFRHWVRPAP